MQEQIKKTNENKIDLLINSDFNTSQFISNLKNFLTRKLTKIKANNQDNLNVCDRY